MIISLVSGDYVPKYLHNTLHSTKIAIATVSVSHSHRQLRRRFVYGVCSVTRSSALCPSETKPGGVSSLQEQHVEGLARRPGYELLLGHRFVAPASPPSVTQQRLQKLALTIHQGEQQGLLFERTLESDQGILLIAGPLECHTTQRTGPCLR